MTSIHNIQVIESGTGRLKVVIGEVLAFASAQQFAAVVSEIFNEPCTVTGPAAGPKIVELTFQLRFPVKVSKPSSAKSSIWRLNVLTATNIRWQPDRQSSKVPD